VRRQIKVAAFFLTHEEGYCGSVYATLHNLEKKIFTHRILYPAHWLQMDQPLIYFASWEGDQVLHDKESTEAGMDRVFNTII
jgi:hypothetical protein